MCLQQFQFQRRDLPVDIVDGTDDQELGGLTFVENGFHKIRDVVDSTSLIESTNVQNNISGRITC